MSQELIQEIEEDLRRERALKFWKTYGTMIGAGVAAVLIATGGYLGWREYDRRQAAAESVRYFTAMGQAAAGQRDVALAGFTGIARDGRPGFAALARLQEAALKASGGDRPGAQAIYQTIAADGSLPQELRTVASVLATLDSVETSDRAAIDRAIEPLTAQSSAWRHVALEIGAIAAARAGDVARARELYTRIADDQAAPQGVRARAAEMLQALGG